MRPMSHTVTDKKRLQARVRRIEGQVQALGKALDSEAECMTVLQQIASIRGAVNGLMLQVLEGHISGHMSDPDASVQQREADTEQLLEVLRSYLK